MSRLRRRGHSSNEKSFFTSLENHPAWAMIICCAIMAFVFWELGKFGISTWSLLWGKDTEVWVRILAFLPFFPPSLALWVAGGGFANAYDWESCIWVLAFQTLVLLGIAKITGLFLHNVPIEYRYLGVAVIVSWFLKSDFSGSGSSKGEFDDII